MFRWIKNRKEKKEKRRQDKHRRILNAMKAMDTSGSSADYAVYKDEFMFNCLTEHKPHDYEEIDDVSVFSPNFNRIVGPNFRSGLTKDTQEKPPQLPARIFSGTTRSFSVSACREVSNEERFRQRTISLPSFEIYSKTNFPVISDADDEPHYNEPWDCQSNLTVQYETNKIHLRLYQKIDGIIATEEKEFDSRWSRISFESKIYSEIEDTDTGCESDANSHTGSDNSVLRDGTNIRGQTIRLKSLNLDADEGLDSDASSGFYDGLSEIEEEHKIQLLKSLGNPQNTVSSPSLFRFNTYPRFQCSQIDEDSEQYLVPKRSFSFKENTTGNPDLPIQKKTHV